MAARKSTQPKPAAEVAQPITTPAQAAEISITNQPKETNPVEKAAPLTPYDFARLTRASGRGKGGNMWFSVSDGDEKNMFRVADTGMTLADLEAVVRAGIDGMIDAGLALMEIRSRKLWENQPEGYRSFQDYATDRFDLGRTRLYQLIDICEVAGILMGAGRDLPSAGRRIQALARLKGDPEALVAVVDDLTEQTKTGDLTEVSQETVEDEVDRAVDAAALAAGKPAPSLTRNKGAGRIRTAVQNRKSVKSNGSVNGGNLAASVPGTDPAKALAASKKMTADSGQEKNRQAVQLLKNVGTGLDTGAFDSTDPQVVAHIQSIAGRLLTFLAHDWTVLNAKPAVNEPKPMVVSLDHAKRIVKLVRAEQEKEKAAAEAKRKEYEAEAAKLDASNKAKLNLAKEAEVAPAAAALSMNPKTEGEAAAILSAYTAWTDGGKKGVNPVTGTQLRRAQKLIDNLTEIEVAAQVQAAEATEVAVEADEEEEGIEDEEDEDEDEDEDEEVAPNVTVLSRRRK